MKLVQPLFHLGWLEERSCRENLHIEKQNLQLATNKTSLTETCTYYKGISFRKKKSVWLTVFMLYYYML